MDTVSNDDVAGATIAVRHLVGLGHRRITHLSGGDNPISRDRERGYLDAMAEAGLSAEARVVAGSLTDTGGYAAARRALAADPRPTALVVANDIAALGAIAAVQEAGLPGPRRRLGRRVRRHRARRPAHPEPDHRGPAAGRDGVGRRRPSVRAHRQPALTGPARQRRCHARGAWHDRACLAVAPRPVGEPARGWPAFASADVSRTVAPVHRVGHRELRRACCCGCGAAPGAAAISGGHMTRARLRAQCQPDPRGQVVIEVHAREPCVTNSTTRVSPSHACPTASASVDLLEALHDPVDLRGPDPDPVGVQGRIRSAVDDEAAARGPLGEVAVRPDAGEAVEVRRLAGASRRRPRRSPAARTGRGCGRPARPAHRRRRPRPSSAQHGRRPGRGRAPGSLRGGPARWAPPRRSSRRCPVPPEIEAR